MPQLNTKQESLGVGLAILSAAMWGMFPVLVSQGVKTIPPLTFAAISTLLAATGSFIYAAAQGNLHELRKKEAYYSLLMITLCIVVIPYILFFIGATKTSGINASMLLLSEMIFTILFTPFFGEKTTKYKLLGSGGVLLGALFILYNGTFRLNTGDILIIFSTLTSPIGNLYAKRALNIVSPSIILTTRFFLGGIMILGFALWFERGTNFSNIIHMNWPILLLNGLFFLGVAKVVWYECLKRLDISKAISLTITFPLFSLVALVLFFNETISLYQSIGVAIMMIGVYFSAKRKSVDPTKTAYAPE